MHSNRSRCVQLPGVHGCCKATVAHKNAYEIRSWLLCITLASWDVKLRAATSTMQHSVEFEAVAETSIHAFHSPTHCSGHCAPVLEHISRAGFPPRDVRSTGAHLTRWHEHSIHLRLSTPKETVLLSESRKAAVGHS